MKPGEAVVTGTTRLDTGKHVVCRYNFGLVSEVVFLLVFTLFYYSYPHDVVLLGLVYYVA